MSVDKKSIAEEEKTRSKDVEKSDEKLPYPKQIGFIIANEVTQ